MNADGKPGHVPSLMGAARHREVLLVILFPVVIVPFVIADQSFASVNNLRSIASVAAIVMVLGVGMTMVLVTGGIDASVASAVLLAAYVCGMVDRGDATPLIVVAVAGCAVGLAVGAANALLVAAMEIPPIIATLATLSLVAAVQWGISNNGEIIAGSDLSPAYLHFADLDPLGVPILAWLTCAVIAIGAFVMRFARWGRDLYFIGTNPGAARLAGIPVQRRLALAYVISGGVSGLAGFMYMAHYQWVGGVTTDLNLLFTVIAGVVVGGVSLSGGTGTVIGAAIGALMLGTINSGLSIVKLSSFAQTFVSGLAIVAVVTGDTLFSRSVDRKARAARKKRVTRNTRGGKNRTYQEAQLEGVPGEVAVAEGETRK